MYVFASFSFSPSCFPSLPLLSFFLSFLPFDDTDTLFPFYPFPSPSSLVFRFASLPFSRSFLLPSLPQVEEMLLSKDDKKAVALFGDKITIDQITHLEEKLKVKKIQPPVVAPQFPAPQ